MADRFEDLRTFVTIVETGGINAAAAALSIAKSAVSRRLADLEERIGAKLVERTTRRFETTAAGEEYYRRAKQLLSAVEDLDSTFRDQADIRIAMDVAPVLINPVVAATISFQRLYSGVTITITQSQSMESDIVVGTDGGAGRKVGSFQRILSASPAYLASAGVPGSIAALKGHRTIAITGEDTWHRGIAALATPASTLVLPDVATALEAVSAGAGIASLPDFVVAELIERGDLQAIPDITEGMPVEVFVTVKPEALALARLLADHFARSLLVTP